MATNGYILVKDKDGKMKYFKDGAYFTPEQVKAAWKQKSSQTQAVAAKKALAPVYSYETRAPKPVPVQPMKQAEPAKPVPAPKVVAVSESLPLEKARSAPVDVEFETLESSGDSKHKREADQNLINELVTGAIQRLKVKFSDPLIENRFRQVLATYFRGVRTSKEISYLLALPKMSGGLELPKDKVMLVVAALEKTAEEAHKTRRDIAASPASTRPVNSSNRGEPFNMEMLKKAEDVEHQLAAPVPVKVAPTLKVEAPKPIVQTNTMKRTVAVPIQAEVTRPSSVTIDKSKQPRPQIRDLNVDRRLVGPVEELGVMDVVNFRQLGKSPDEIKEQLKKKITYLAEQSLTKKVEGVQAWKRSPVFRLYVAMTYAGLRERQSMAEIIRARQIANSDCLTLSEYEMIGALNAEIAL